ncbi:MAG: 4Fe-4S ferredoxin [Deltaproteobacteria bacterium]|nr:4Fe-4S ferredoxin [Deltaproteobacteria bacterium]
MKSSHSQLPAPLTTGLAPNPTVKIIRDIVEIDYELCDGCGLCLPGCAEGALAIENGRVCLVGESLCDGLGACLGRCPKGALKIVQRCSEEFDPQEVEARRRAAESPDSRLGGQINVLARPHRCPGTETKILSGPAGYRDGSGDDRTKNQPEPEADTLSTWPVQLSLVPPAAPFFNQQVLILSADCVAFAAIDFRRLFLGRNYPLVIGCPKLDDRSLYEIKLKVILQKNPAIREVWLPIMRVPCCQGLWQLAKSSLAASNRIDVALKGWVFTPEGQTVESAVALNSQER